jgi:ribosomal protein S4
MVSFIQKTNRNSFTLRYKKYKKFRSDIWGNLAFVNKKNALTTQMRKFAEEDLRKRLRQYPNKKKREIFQRFGLNKGFLRSFEYSVKLKAQAKRKKPLTMRGLMMILRKKLNTFYYCRLKRKSLRKLFSKKNIKKHRLYNTPIYQTNNASEKFLTPSLTKGSVGSILESRIDVILYRLNFIQSIYEGRSFVKTKKAFVLAPCKNSKIYRKFFSFITLKKHYYKVPLFHFVSLRYDLSLLRKVVLINLINASKLLAYPPDYLMVNYKTMIGLRHTNPPVNRIRYPFHGTLAYFIGTAIYF